jgi:hypothetical protein
MMRTIVDQASIENVEPKLIVEIGISITNERSLNTKEILQNVESLSLQL